MCDVKTTALLVVDVQEGFMQGDFAVYNAPEFLARTRELIEWARQESLPVVYVQHNEAPEYDGPIHHSIAPLPTDPIVLKIYPDAFYETNLQEVLTDLGVQKLILMGLQTEMCVNSTLRAALQRNYEVTVIEDMHTTIDADQPATAIIAEHNQTFKQLTSVVPLSKLMKEGI
jgi:nicotinamidase-related amidase